MLHFGHRLVAGSSASFVPQWKQNFPPRVTPQFKQIFAMLPSSFHRRAAERAETSSASLRLIAPKLWPQGNAQDETHEGADHHPGQPVPASIS